MESSQRVRFISVAVALLAPVMPAFAADTCAVQKSDDGFVALRAEPSADSAELARANTGEVLVVQETENGEKIADGDWLKVFHYPGEMIPDTQDPEYSHGKIGWMPKRFVGDCG